MSDMIMKITEIIREKKLVNDKSDMVLQETLEKYLMLESKLKTYELGILVPMDKIGLGAEELGLLVKKIYQKERGHKCLD